MLRAGAWRGLGDLLDFATEQVTVTIEGVHNAAADRWFGLAGSRAAPVRLAHRAFTAGIYGSVRVAGSALGTVVGLVGDIAGGRTGVRASRISPSWNRAQAVANAAWGDEFERRDNDLQIELGLRNPEGLVIRPDPVGLADAFLEPTGRLVVLLHGLGQTERCWLGRESDAETTLGLSDVLASDSLVPLLVRYNTGRHVSENGHALAILVERIVNAWPVPVVEVALVGGSMGGLVARSSVHAGRDCGHRWTTMVRHVVTLGSPHLGAPLEKMANVISWGLRTAPEARPLGSLLDGRSAGIKDLRFGAIREDDWRGADPDALLCDAVGEQAKPEGVELHFVAGVVTADPGHRFGAVVGDLMVRISSGTGRGRRRQIEATDVRVLGGRHHFHLAHDRAVHQQVRDWLTTTPSRRPPA